MAGFNPNTINLKAGLDTKGVATGVQQIQGHMGKMSKNVNKIKRSFGGLGGVIAGAFAVRSLVNFASSATLLAEETQTAKARIDNIARSMGIFGDQTTKVTDAIKQYAVDNELLFATDRNVIMATQAKLLTFKELAKTAGELGGAFNRATQITIDMAAAGFGTATDNAVQLGKALNDPIKGISALSRSGITFTDQEKEKIRTLVESNRVLEAQDMILKAIEKQVGGTAEATGDATVKMGIHFDKIKRQIGERLLPLVERFEKGFTRLNKNISKYGVALVSQLDPNVIKAMETNAAFNARKFAEGQKNAVVELNLVQKRLGYEKKIGEIKEKLAKVQEGSVDPRENLRRMKMQVYYTNMLLLLNRDLDALTVKGGGGGVVEDPLTALLDRIKNLDPSINSIQDFNDALKELREIQLTSPASQFVMLEKHVAALKAQIEGLTTVSKYVKPTIISLTPKTTVGDLDTKSMADDLKEFNATMKELEKNLPTFSQTWDDNILKMQRAWQSFKDNFQSSIQDFVANTLFEFANEIGRAMGGATDSFDNFGHRMLASFGAFLSQMGKMFIAFGVARTALADALDPKTIANPAKGIQLIAAGAAMAIIGGAITGAMSKYSQSGSAGAGGVPTQSGGMGYNFETRLDGYDLVLVQGRNQRLMNRRG